MLRKQLYNIVFQKQVFSGGSNPNEGSQQQSQNENNEDRFVPPVIPNMPNAIQKKKPNYYEILDQN